jgi:prepilin-type N-terminal cleavage/methylation domain-containing protein
MPSGGPGTDVGVDDASATRDLGFTLIEIVIAVAVVAMTVAAGVGISLASRSYAVSAAAAEFDHLLDSARTIARETEGVTLAFEPDAYGDGTEVRVLAPGPNGTLIATTLPTFHTRATIEETESLGKAPFGFVIHASGSLGGRPGFRRTTSSPPPEVGCPARGSFHFTIHTAGTTADRFIPCRISLAANGPIAFATWPPATIAPLPTPCAGPCMPATAPTVPSVSATCPPNYAVALDGCIPSNGLAPHYHITATLASPSVAVGGTDAVTIQAALVGSSATSGIPATVPVAVQALTATCSVTPTTTQPSGSTFTVTGLFAGACSATAAADTAGIPSATADSASLSITVTLPESQAPGPPSPLPRNCDVVTNEKCYQRIIGPVSQTFWKYVIPDTACGDIGGGTTCWYIDSVKLVYLAPGYGFQPPVRATDSAHELLFKIDSVATVLSQCQPYSFFAASPVGFISWQEEGVGAPLDAPIGFGSPSLFFTSNHVINDFVPNGVFDVQPGSVSGTTFSEIYDTVARRITGEPYMFTYSGNASTTSSYIQWHPDFAGCDAAGDATNTSAIEYGNAGVSLVFEVFQASM